MGVPPPLNYRIIHWVVLLLLFLMLSVLAFPKHLEIALLEFIFCVSTNCCLCPFLFSILLKESQAKDRHSESSVWANQVEGRQRPEVAILLVQDRHALSSLNPKRRKEEGKNFESTCVDLAS